MYCVVKAKQGKDVRIRYDGCSTEYPLDNPIIIVQGGDTSMYEYGFKAGVKFALTLGCNIIIETLSTRAVLRGDYPDVGDMVDIVRYAGDPLLHDFKDTVKYPYKCHIMWVELYQDEGGGVHNIRPRLYARQYMKATNYNPKRNYKRKLIMRTP